jgi:L-arabinose transport system substrate-binding protein
MISPLCHGYETTELLYKWIKDGVEPPMDTRTSGVIATRENYKEKLKELGLEEAVQ